MKVIKKYFGYVLATLVVSLIQALPAFAHTANDNWGHHMAGGFWGWGPMVLFWIAGLLLIALLSVTLIKALRD